VSDDNLYALLAEPDWRTKTYTTCIVGGVWYHTKAREANRKTQNSGIMTTGSHKDIVEIEFYGSLRDIIELRYNSGLARHRTVVLFQVDWYDLEGTKKEPKIRNDGYFISVNNGDYCTKMIPTFLLNKQRRSFTCQTPYYNTHGEWCKNLSTGICAAIMNMRRT
jgi:hypothetical protein